MVLLKITNLSTGEFGYTKNPVLAITYAEVAMDCEDRGEQNVYLSDPYRIELVRMSEEEIAKISDDQWGRK